MRQPIVVGLAGLAGAGKSTIADLLVSSLNGQSNSATHLRVLRHPFAGPIKQGLSLMGITKEKTPEAYRTFAQTIGAGMRARDPDHWVRLHASGINVLPTVDSLQSLLIADDVRYENECRRCSFVYFISRPTAGSPLTPGQLAHESESMGLSGYNPALHTLSVVNPEGSPSHAAHLIITDLLSRLPQ